MDKYNSKIPLIFAPNGTKLWAITISKNTTLYSCPIDSVNATWRKHEDKHKQQFKDEGWFKFVIKYLYYQVKYGYQNNPYEIEARNYSVKL